MAPRTAVTITAARLGQRISSGEHCMLPAGTVGVVIDDTDRHGRCLVAAVIDVAGDEFGAAASVPVHLLTPAGGA